MNVVIVGVVVVVENVRVGEEARMLQELLKEGRDKNDDSEYEDVGRVYVQESLQEE